MHRRRHSPRDTSRREGSRGLSRRRTLTSRSKGVGVSTRTAPSSELVTPSGSAPLFSMQNVEVRYGSALALADVSVAVDAGSVLAVVGANGAGKSTLARAASGLVPVRSGTITFAGNDVTGWRPSRIRRAGMIHLPEG